MKVLEVTNVNEAVAVAIPYLLEYGEREESRNGTVIVAPTPVMTVYRSPLERVLFSGTRDANPFFHLMESLWMLAGRNDLGFPSYFNKKFELYSDDGETVHGAYGHRWRKSFGYDQLEVLIQELKSNPASRRCVLAMWDPTPTAMNDLHKAMNGGKDVPCNTHAYFDLRHSELNMTICCRSNDVIWGAYGANAVHMSFLQEYVAARLGVGVGVYRQFSNNFHAYTDTYDIEKLKMIASEAANTNYYKEVSGGLTPYPLMTVHNSLWMEDLQEFLSNPMGMRRYHDQFFNEVASPMYHAWHNRKEKISNGEKEARQIRAADWRVACLQWIHRREAKEQHVA